MLFLFVNSSASLHMLEKMNPCVQSMGRRCARLSSGILDQREGLLLDGLQIGRAHNLLEFM